MFACVFSQWDGAVRMWEHRQTHPLEEEREREKDWEQVDSEDSCGTAIQEEERQKKMMSQELISPQRAMLSPNRRIIS